MVQVSAVASTDKLETIGKIENWIFYFLCGYALCSSVSMGGANICLGLATVAAIIRLVKKHDDWKDLLRVDKKLRMPFLIFIGTVTITNIFSVDIGISVRNMFQYYINNFEPFILCLMFVRDKHKIIMLAGLGFLSFLINNVECIYQWYIHRDATRGASSTVGRSAGFLRYMSTAGIMAMWVPIQFLLLLVLREKKRKMILVSILISILAILGNNTRGMWLAVAITILVIYFMYIKSIAKFICVIMVSLLCVGLVANQVSWIHNRIMSIDVKDGSNEERLVYLWPSAYKMGSDYPLTGVGSGNFEKMYREQYAMPGSDKDLSHAHSIYFQRFAEHGYSGLIAFGVWIIGTFIYCVRGWRREHNIGYLMYMSIFMGLFLHGVTEDVFGHPITMKLFWFGLGISYQWIRLNKKSIE
ncbi:O-antigen ligase family protein [Anaerovibrio lipolyticus]|uniref:O-antigen ligase family protein n=1 Tax=Anaerovibrio lipolyticus TaxID=82374 RepID=UPI0023F49848|nr:O-antigen ligase family protein [Anaerovibrio lipolyticus]